MKLRSTLILLLIFSATGTYAQDTVNVFINNLKAGQYIIKANQEDGGIWYKKKVYKNMGRLAIEVKGQYIGSNIYKRVVDVTDDKENSLFKAPESPGIFGQFMLTEKSVIKRLSMGKMVKLYLQMDPANDMMKAPSRRIFIGNLTAK